MGRILRKKGSQRARRKKSVDEGAGPQANAGAAAEQAAERSAEDKETSKRQVVSQKRPLPVAKPSEGGAVRNFMEKSLQFLREVKVELKKVTWPSRKQTMGSTVVVIVLVMIISLFLGVVDVSLSSLIRVVF